MTDIEEFYEWLQVGIAQSWVSDVYCSTHDGPPLTDDEEEEQQDDGWDSCVFAVRVWTERLE